MPSSIRFGRERSYSSVLSALVLPHDSTRNDRRRFTTDSFENYLASQRAGLARREAARSLAEVQRAGAPRADGRRVDAHRHPHVPAGQVRACRASFRPARRRPPALLAKGVDAGRSDDARSTAVICPGISIAKWASRGVVFGSLDTLVNEHSDLIRRNLFRAVNPAIDKFAALHGACWSGGSFLYVPRGVVSTNRCTCSRLWPAVRPI